MSSRWWSRLAAVLGSIGLVGSLLLAAAGPMAASSTGKIYGVTVDPTSLPYASPSVNGVAFTVTFTNQTPGNSQISSLILTAPANYTITSAVTPKASSGNLGNYSVNVITSGAQPVIQVTNLYPVGYGQSVTLSFTANVATTNLTCSTEIGTWGTQAWTGSNLSGQPFALTGNAPTTTIGTGKVLAPGGTYTVNGVTITNSATSPCGVPVTVTQGTDSAGPFVQLLKPTVQGVGLTADILWPAAAAQYQVPATTVDTPSPTHTLLWCNGTPSYDASGNLITTNMSMPASLVAPGPEVSCLVSESSKIVGPASGTQSPQLVQVHDLIWLLGDLTFHY